MLSSIPKNLSTFDASTISLFSSLTFNYYPSLGTCILVYGWAGVLLSLLSFDDESEFPKIAQATTASIMTITMITVQYTQTLLRLSYSLSLRDLCLYELLMVLSWLAFSATTSILPSRYINDSIFSTMLSLRCNISFNTLSALSLNNSGLLLYDIILGLRNSTPNDFKL